MIKEDDGQGKRRRELREEKKKLVGFSARLNKLVAQLKEDQDNPTSDYTIEDDADRNDAEDDEGQPSRTNYRPPSAMDFEMGDDDINHDGNFPNGPGLEI